MNTYFWVYTHAIHHNDGKRVDVHKIGRLGFTCMIGTGGNPIRPTVESLALAVADSGLCVDICTDLM